MSEIDIGGQAFPVPPESVTIDGERLYPEFGMTLRDWFAGQALVTVLQHDPRSADITHSAEWSYVIADQMLKARKEQS